jgi:translation elongation factor EF-4
VASGHINLFNIYTNIRTYYYSSKARTVAKALVAKLKDELHRQQFSIAIQAAVGSKILGKEFVALVNQYRYR